MRIIGGAGNFGQSGKVGQFRRSGKIRHVSISRNKLKFEKWDGINIMCSNMHYLQNIMFFVLTYQFSGKVLVSSASPKLPYLTKVPLWK